MLDYGNVLCLWPGAADFEILYRLSGIPEQKFQKCFWRYRRDYDRGSLDGPAYWQKVAQDAAARLTAEQVTNLIAADVQLWQRPDPAMARWVGALRAQGFKTAVLSNMPNDVARGVRQPGNPKFIALAWKGYA
jgi:putative hydrolase of the HAD superfamily